MAKASMWDQRYDIDDYLFGIEASQFLTKHASWLTAGANALAVADGEGRNSVFLAEQGLNVTAMDISEVGAAKARLLAEQRGVVVDVQVADILEWEWTPDSYDFVVAVFIQFLDPTQRLAVFTGMQRTLRPGGHLLLHGYRPEQIAYGTGGPREPANMYTEEDLAAAFGEMQIDVLESYDISISEGPGHDGTSALIDLVATKR